MRPHSESRGHRQRNVEGCRQPQDAGGGGGGGAPPGPSEGAHLNFRLLPLPSLPFKNAHQTKANIT